MGRKRTLAHDASEQSIRLGFAVLAISSIRARFVRVRSKQRARRPPLANEPILAPKFRASAFAQPFRDRDSICITAGPKLVPRLRPPEAQAIAHQHERAPCRKRLG